MFRINDNNSEMSALWQGLRAASNSADSASKVKDSTSGIKAATAKDDGVDLQDALEKVQDAKLSASNETFKAWDKHTDMVAKSQELRMTKMRKDAIDRQTQDRRDANTELMAEMAIENANRSKFLEASAFERKASEISADDLSAAA